MEEYTTYCKECGTTDIELFDVGDGLWQAHCPKCGELVGDDGHPIDDPMWDDKC